MYDAWDPEGIVGWLLWFLGLLLMVPLVIVSVVVVAWLLGLLFGGLTVLIDA